MTVATKKRRHVMPAVALASLLALANVAVAATHYPPNAKCNDCHATSQLTMVVGTRLIRKSAATAELGITAANPTIKCLFCHRADAVAVPKAVMKPVWDQFDAQSASKHRAGEDSDFVPDAAQFDCLDCHTSLVNAGVVSDGAGNATIHGRDASQSVATTNLPVWRTLIGSFSSAPTDLQLSSQTCGNAACHGYVGTAAPVYGSYVTPKQHGYASVSLHNIGSFTPTNCVTQCHGSHNSYQGSALLILRNNGTSSNAPTDPPSTRLTPDQCGECHAQDDADAMHDYGTKGHGKPTIRLACTGCHDPNAPHDFQLMGTNPLRFSLAVDVSSKSSIRRHPPYDQAFSVCLTCHRQFEGKAHGTAAVAGCNDCHEPHGTGTRINTATVLGIQARMIRPAIPKTDPAGVPLYGLGTTVGTWETNVFGTSSDTYRPDGQALCDNAECHAGRTSPVGAPTYPLASFLLGTGHTGGATIVTTSQNFNCEGCHSHTDSKGSWGAGDACDKCHGYPPTTNAHPAHSGAGMTCANCHPGPGTQNHNGAGLSDAAQFQSAWASNPGVIRNQVQVAFTQVIATGYRVGSYTLPMTTSARYNLTTYGTCAGVGCHGSTLPTADRGTQLSPTWNISTSGACGTCHRATAAAFLTTGSGSHVLHGATVPTGRGIGCQYCHWSTTYNGSTITGSVHVNGLNDVQAGTATYNGFPVGFGYAAPNCADNSCHDASRPLAWGAAASCDNCHGTFATAGGMDTTVVARHRNADWTIGTGFASYHTGIATGTARECDYCHANRQATYITTPGSDMHLDGKIQLNSAMGYLGTSGAGGPASGCTASCHGGDAPFQMADSSCPLQLLTGQGLPTACTGCHGNSTTGNWWPDGTAENGGGYPNQPGDHPKHIAAIANAMNWATTTLKNGSCSWCHPMTTTSTPLPNHTANTAGSLAGRADVARDGLQTTNFKRINGTVNALTSSSYAHASQVCSAVDCHNRAPTPANGWTNPPDWTVGLDARCSNTSCHASSTYDASNSPGFEGSHLVHVGSGTYRKNYLCTECHPVVTTFGHQNTLIQFKFDNPGSVEGLAGGGDAYFDNKPEDGLADWIQTYDAEYSGTCRKVYCHGGDNSEWGGSVTAPYWGGNHADDCGACHKTTVNHGWQGLSAGSHEEHLYLDMGPRLNYSPYHPGDVNGTCRCHNIAPMTTTSESCNYCHSNLIGVAALPTPTHVNGRADFYNAGNPMGTTLAGTKVCDECHSTYDWNGPGSNGAAQAKALWWTWGTSNRLDCRTCHNTVDPGLIPANPWSNESRAAAKDNALYLSGGHGRVSTYPATGSPAAGLGCTGCHDPAAYHVSHEPYGSIYGPPYVNSPNHAPRLKAARVESPALAYTTAASEFCLDCHQPGAGAGNLGVNATRKASVHSGGVTGKYNTLALANLAFPAYGDAANYTANPGYQCDACHDAHGTAKAAMVLSTLDGRLRGFSNPRPVTSLFDAATATSLGGLDPTAAADDGVCDLCHMAGGYAAHFDTAHPGNHNQTGVVARSCVGCHNHEKSFQGQCYDCHGSAGAGNWWPDGTAGNGSGYPNRPGAHQKHIDVIYARNGATLMGTTATDKKNRTCEWCHSWPGSPGHEVNTVSSPESTADVLGDASLQGLLFTPLDKVYDFDTYIGNAFAVYDNSSGANGKRCTNAECHWMTPTPVTGAPTTDGDGWYNPAAVATCSSCHGDGVNGAPLPGAHLAHVAPVEPFGAPPAAWGRAYACTQCHPSHGSDLSHTNHLIDMTVQAAIGEPGLVAGSVIGARPRPVYGTNTTSATCLNLYCHGADMNNGGSKPVPNWGNPTTGDCGTCHGINGDPVGKGTGGSNRPAYFAVASGNHQTHFASARGPRLLDNHAADGCFQCHASTTPANYRIGCSHCHAGDLWNTFPGASNPSPAHVDGKVDFGNTDQTTVAVSALGTTAPTAGPTAQDTDRCNSCHSTALVGGQAGAARAKANWSNASYELPCLSCHNASDAATSSADSTGVAAPAKDLHWSTTGHGRPTAGGNYPATANAPANYIEERCTVCHDDEAQHLSGTLNDSDRLKPVAENPALTYTSATSEVCLDCHKVGQATNGTLGKNAARKATVHSGAVTGSYNTLALAPNAFPAYGDSANYAANPGYQCDACHDPHGTAKVAMLLGTLDGRLAGVSNPKPVSTSFNAATATSLTALDPTAAPDDGVCDLCHRAVGTTAPHPDTAHAGNHNQGGTGDSCAGCHDHAKSFQAACESCHDQTGGPGGTAPKVLWRNGSRAGPPGVTQGGYGSHLVAAKTESAFSGSTDWTGQCKKCHAGHSGSVKVPSPPTSWADPSGRLTGVNMQTRLGLTYTQEVGVSVHLGGSATIGTTEAEVCWNCHKDSANNVSEWGFNTKTSPVGFPVVWAMFTTQHDGAAPSENYGRIYADASYTYPGGLITDWTAGYWANEYEPLLKRRIASVHSASFNPAGQSSSVAANVKADGTVERASPTLEAKGAIRCSYCHDVHDLNRASGAGYGPDSTSGKPFLRGRWVGNPYPAQVPARSAYTYTHTVASGAFATPRPVSSAQEKGGFFIDQNSGAPTGDPSMDSLPEVAELCVLCHGSSVDTMNFYTGASLWRVGMVNGHSNSTLGGTGANKVNLFDGNRGVPYYNGNPGGANWMGMQDALLFNGGYMMGASWNGSAWVWADYPNLPMSNVMYLLYNWAAVYPSLSNTGWYGADFANWYDTGGIGGGSGPGTLAHKFTCSKCHTPHASGLPALLTQNCIDTGLTDFSRNITTGYPGGRVVPTTNAANNCHRKTTRTDGWHNLAPGQ